MIPDHFAFCALQCRLTSHCTHRKYQSPQSDLACHGGIRPHQAPRHQGNQDRCYGNPCRGPVFADGTGREVDMDVSLQQRILGRLQLQLWQAIVILLGKKRNETGQ